MCHCVLKGIVYLIAYLKLDLNIHISLVIVSLYQRYKQNLLLHSLIILFIHLCYFIILVLNFCVDLKLTMANETGQQLGQNVTEVHAAFNNQLINMSAIS